MECTEERIKISVYEYIYDATVGVGGKDQTVSDVSGQEFISYYLLVLRLGLAASSNSS